MPAWRTGPGSAAVSNPPVDRMSPRHPLRAAFGLALAAAVSLGLARFAYALLLPAMRAELGWSYLVAGAMNTANAAGYLAGALLLPRVLARCEARRVLLTGGLATVPLLGLHALAPGELALYALRFLTGVASALSFVAGGVLAARLASLPERGAGPTPRAGLILGLYYGGTGLGIVAASALLPPLLADPPVLSGGWRAGWALLAGVALLATGLTARLSRGLQLAPSRPAVGERFRWAPLRFGLAGYAMFGLGYLGTMTFIVSLLREQGWGPGAAAGFYALLGAGCVASSWLWAGLLQRHRDGRPMALLNGLLALATALPVLWPQALAVLASGLLFGSVFLSVVASTTALVRHNTPPAAWSGGISAFTIVFASAQIVGPSLIGALADGAGNLGRGFLVSAALLALGSLLALGQRAR